MKNRLFVGIYHFDICKCKHIVSNFLMGIFVHLTA